MAKKTRPKDRADVYEPKPRRTRRHKPTRPINRRHKKARKPKER